MVEPMLSTTVSDISNYTYCCSLLALVYTRAIYHVDVTHRDGSALVYTAVTKLPLSSFWIWGEMRYFTVNAKLWLLLAKGWLTVAIQCKFRICHLLERLQPKPCTALAATRAVSERVWQIEPNRKYAVQKKVVLELK